MTAGGIAWDVEEACIAGFPALREAVCRGWLVRFSGNTRRTANSATPLRLDFAAPDGVIAACEALYRRQGQTAIFRIPSFLDPAMDEGLAARGYTAEAETCVIRGGIDAVAAAGDAGGVELAARPSPGWLARMGRLQNYSPEDAVGMTTELHRYRYRRVPSIL